MFPVVSRWIFGGSGQCNLQRDTLSRKAMMYQFLFFNCRRFWLFLSQGKIRWLTLSWHIIDLNFCFERERVDNIIHAASTYAHTVTLKSFFLTQEVEFCRKWQSISIRNKGVVSSVLWFHIVNHQPVKPETSIWEHDGVLTSPLQKNGKKCICFWVETKISKCTCTCCHPYLPTWVILIRSLGRTSTPSLNHFPVTLSSDTSHLNKAWSVALTVRSAMSCSTSSSFSKWNNENSKRIHQAGNRHVELPWDRSWFLNVTFWHALPRAVILCINREALRSAVKFSWSLYTEWNVTFKWKLH